MKVCCYLGGLLAAFNLVNAGLSQSDPVSDALQLVTVFLDTLRHPGSNHSLNMHIYTHWIIACQGYCIIQYKGERNLRHLVPCLLYILQCPESPK